MNNYQFGVSFVISQHYAL